VPQKLYARFSGFGNFTYRSSSAYTFQPRPPEAETAAAEWLNTILVDIPLVGITPTLPGIGIGGGVSYATEGCETFMVGGVMRPCPNCDPPFNATVLDGSREGGAGVYIPFFCSGGFSLPVYNRFGEQRPRWFIGPSVGCEPPGLRSLPIYTPLVTNMEIFFARSQVQQNWCDIARGLTTSFTLSAESSQMSLSNSFNFFIYNGSGGTVTISTNPLP
jgi:hypothetical protein